MSTWVVGDVHGCYDEFQTIITNPEIKEEDTIILIGDIIDRGINSYKMLAWAVENISEDGKYQMILGNHEDTVIDEFKQAVRRMKYIPNAKLSTVEISSMNTHYDFDTYMFDNGFDTLAKVKPYVDWMKKLPLVKFVEANSQKYVIAHAWYDKSLDKDIIVWERDIDRWNNLTGDYKSYDGEILIHGHTPTIVIEDCKEKPVNEILIRENSINIDCGCVFPQYGGNLAAIRLEDMKVIYARKQEKITY